MAVSTMKTQSNDLDTGLNAKSRKDVAHSLAGTLADTYVLQLKTKFYHWNVTGANFKSLHELFDAQYTELSDAVDELAERIRAVGVNAPGTFREFATLASVKEDKVLPGSWSAMVNNLLVDHEEIIRALRSKIPAAQKAGDEGSADLFIGRLQAHEKAAWMLRSHL